MDTHERIGAEALATLKNRDSGDSRPDLFAEITDKLPESFAGKGKQGRFWLGSLFGAAVAASVLAMAVSLGWYSVDSTVDAGPAEFVVLVGEPRTMDIAIEIDRPLGNATISVLLSGDVALDGYSNQRELTWQSDLHAGINRLSLPVLALDGGGGQLIVRLDHPQSEQIFMVRLKTES